MKIIGWNVNGIRSCVKKGFVDFVSSYSPDILAVQEVKGIDEPIRIEGYEGFYNLAEKKGYSGTALFFRTPPLDITTGLDDDEFNHEGRVITAEYPVPYLCTLETVLPF